VYSNTAFALFDLSKSRQTTRETQIPREEAIADDSKTVNCGFSLALKEIRQQLFVYFNKGCF
jgi:hypothetical protein